MSDDARHILNERGSAWFDAVSSRRSWRSYDGRPLAADDLGALVELAESFRPYDDARCVVVTEAAPDLFQGIVGSYGGVKRAPSALLVIVRETERGQQHAGYTGEALVLEAASRGIHTCWIGGAFDRAKAAGITDLAEDERVVCVSPLGHHTAIETLTDQLMHRAARSHTRKSPAQMTPLLTDDWPAWARVAVECARLAPSAMNRQPWLFELDDDGLAMRVAPGRERAELTRALDCGIAMLHAEIGARQCAGDVRWSEDVAEGVLAVLVAEEEEDA